MKKHLIDELKKLTRNDNSIAHTTGERVLAAILLDIHERENKEKEAENEHICS